MFQCEKCPTISSTVFYKDSVRMCSQCYYEIRGAANAAPYVITDEIPGGVEIKHGVCNPDGTPKRYYSKSSIREAAFQSGYFQGTDTPKVNHRLQEERAKQTEARRRSN